MLKRVSNTLFFISLLMALTLSKLSIANTLPIVNKQSVNPTINPIMTPTPPNVDARAYILVDANSGKVLAEKNADERFAPASLTKIMTMYVISDALTSNRISLDDEVTVSKKAWRTGGSKMFIEVGDKVKISDLIQGIAVASGNDASVAMAEHLAGSEASFSQVMNQHAQLLGMKNSHFTDSSGLPHEQQYSSARDMAILSQNFIKKYPEEYNWFKQKWFTYNEIRQPNRNRLLWRSPHVDGIKTGYTEEAGYCLVASSNEEGNRLISVIMGAPSESQRTADSQRLLTYGARFFDTEKLYTKGQALAKPRIWKGEEQTIPVGLASDMYITVPKGQYQRIKINLEIPSKIQAPINKGQTLGNVVIELNDEIIATRPVIALQGNPTGGLFTRLRDTIGMSFHNWLGGE